MYQKPFRMFAILTIAHILVTGLPLLTRWSISRSAASFRWRLPHRWWRRAAIRRHIRSAAPLTDHNYRFHFGPATNNGIVVSIIIHFNGCRWFRTRTILPLQHISCNLKRLKCRIAKVGSTGNGGNRKIDGSHSYRISCSRSLALLCLTHSLFLLLLLEVPKRYFACGCTDPLIPVEPSSFLCVETLVCARFSGACTTVNPDWTSGSACARLSRRTCKGATCFFSGMLAWNLIAQLFSDNGTRYYVIKNHIFRKISGGPVCRVPGTVTWYSSTY